MNVWTKRKKNAFQKRERKIQKSNVCLHGFNVHNQNAKKAQENLQHTWLSAQFRANELNKFHRHDWLWRSQNLLDLWSLQSKVGLANSASIYSAPFSFADSGVTEAGFGGRVWACLFLYSRTRGIRMGLKPCSNLQKCSLSPQGKRPAASKGMAREKYFRIKRAAL